MNGSILPPLGNYEAGEDFEWEKLEWEEFVIWLARYAPRLKRVENALGMIGMRIWGISRCAGQRMKVKLIDEPFGAIGRSLYA